MPGDLLTVHYVGSLASDGTVFDSSRAKGVPFQFTLGKGEVIRGWELALTQMSCGERAKVHIAAEAGYGAKGCKDKANAHGTGVIPPNAALIFDIELLDVNGRRSLSRFLNTLFEWVASKMATFDGGDAAARAAIEAKHGGRDEYHAHLQQLAVDKYEKERAKRGPRAPTIEQVTAKLEAAIEALSTGGALAGNDAATSVEACATAAAATTQKAELEVDVS